MDCDSNGNPISDHTQKSGSKKASSRRGSRPSVSAYQKVARQPNNVITSGVLSDRARAPRITDMEGQINLEMAEKFNEDVAAIESQIFGSKGSIKGKKKGGQTHG